jgi:hypothetical protein
MNGSNQCHFIRLATDQTSSDDPSSLNKPWHYTDLPELARFSGFMDSSAAFFANADGERLAAHGESAKN